MVGVATAVALGFPGRRLSGSTASCVRGLNNMFSVFSNRAYATLVGVQFLVQAGQGVNSRSVREVDWCQPGFNVTRGLPSAQYLLGGAGPLRPLHAGEPVHRRRSRADWEPAGVLSLSTVRSRPSWSRSSRSRSCWKRQGDVRGQRRRDRRPSRRAAVHPRVHPRGARREVRHESRASCPARTSSQATAFAQAGGALFQVVGIGSTFGAAAAGSLSWIVVVIRAGVLVVAVANRLDGMENRAAQDDVRPGGEAGRLQASSPA